MTQSVMQALITSAYESKIFTLICATLLAWALFGPALVQASDNERYKAIPMASGGYVFIIDTREGHAWTWNNAGQGQVSPSGVNPHIVYQGNVRKNMSPPKTVPISPPSKPPSAQPERF